MMNISAIAAPNNAGNPISSINPAVGRVVGVA